MEYGLIGEHLPHSFSKEIHGRCADYDYQVKELTPEQVEPFLAARNFKAINVTIPYKKTVIPFLSYVDEGAKAIGAVNTVVNRDGRLYGYNTDFYGMQALIKRIGIPLTDKKVLILGAGGTSRTAQAVAKAAKAAEVIVVGRPKDHPDVTYEEAYELHADADVIINTTPCGMYPYADGTPDRASTPADLSRFPHLQGVVDVVYNPLRTNLVLDAQARHISSEGGLYMLVAQAVKACRIFRQQSLPTTDSQSPTGTYQQSPADTDQQPSAGMERSIAAGGAEADFEGMEEQTEAIFRDILAQKENIVLTGMPGSGKTTVGRELARAWNRPFVDTDEEIVKESGKEISQIFEEVGEEGFRELEARVLRQIANESAGAVIATGGGAVLREENVRALKRTGRIYFLDRALEALLPTPDRPLASTAEDLRRRYEERYGRYCETCDVRVETDQGPEQTAEIIGKDFFG